MPRLKDFIRYLDDRIETVVAVEKKLCDLQEKYESYFSEVAKVRESELQQLTAHILEARTKERGDDGEEPHRDPARKSVLPNWFDQALDKAQMEVEKDYDAQLNKLQQERDSTLKKAEQQRISSVKAERAIRKKNVGLDRQEEELKSRNEHLLEEIKSYNEKIRAMSRGFGFFANFFKMRRLAEQRRTLDLEQADVVARIDALRSRWADEEGTYTKKEFDLQKQWVELETEASALQTKLDYLRKARARIVLRSTVERVLFDLVKEPPQPKEEDPPCPRCKVPNPDGNHFCHICAQRLVQDRPDFEGSIQEIAEVNLHHGRFADGMKACQEIIGLIRGLRSGLEAFKESVVDMRSSESQHNLSPLSLDVPPKSVEYGKNFDALRQSMGQDLSLHPKAMADHVDHLVTKVFTEDKIKDYFETMGEELSRQAESQW